MVRVTIDCVLLWLVWCYVCTGQCRIVWKVASCYIFHTHKFMLLLRISYSKQKTESRPIYFKDIKCIWKLIMLLTMFTNKWWMLNKLFNDFRKLIQIINCFYELQTKFCDACTWVRRLCILPNSKMILCNALSVQSVTACLVILANCSRGKIVC